MPHRLWSWQIYFENISNIFFVVVNSKVIIDPQIVIPYIIYQLTGRGIVLSFSNAIRSAISKSWVSITKSSLNGSSEFERQTFLLLWGSLHSPESFLFFKLSTSGGPLFSSMSSPKINLAFFRVSAEILNCEPLAVANPPKPELVSLIPDILSSFSLPCCLWWKSVRWVKKNRTSTLVFHRDLLSHFKSYSTSLYICSFTKICQIWSKVLFFTNYSFWATSGFFLLKTNYRWKDIW